MITFNTYKEIEGEKYLPNEFMIEGTKYVYNPHNTLKTQSNKCDKLYTYTTMDDRSCILAFVKRNTVVAVSKQLVK